VNYNHPEIRNNRQSTQKAINTNTGITTRLSPRQIKQNRKTPITQLVENWWTIPYTQTARKTTRKSNKANKSPYSIISKKTLSNHDQIKPQRIQGATEPYPHWIQSKTLNSIKGPHLWKKFRFNKKKIKTWEELKRNQ